MELLVLDSRLIPIRLIDDHLGLNWANRYSDTGKCEIILPKTREYGELFNSDNIYLQIPESPDPQVLMVPEKVVSINDPVNGGTITVNGETIDTIFKRRIIRNNDVLKGPIEDVIFAFIRGECIDTSAERKFPNLTLRHNPDPELAKIVIDSSSHYNKELYETVVQLCQNSSVGFKMEVTSEGGLVFSLYLGEDRSYAQNKNGVVLFSYEFENLISSNYARTTSDKKNVCYVRTSYIKETQQEIRFYMDEESDEYIPFDVYETAEKKGDKELSLEKHDEYFDFEVTRSDASGYDRREMYLDVPNDLQTNSKSVAHENAQLMANEALDEASITEAFDGELDSYGQFIYGRDYKLGDIVQVEDNDGHYGTCRVSEVVVSQDASGAYTVPTFTFI